jgi:hypothetical protein
LTIDKTDETQEPEPGCGYGDDDQGFDRTHDDTPPDPVFPGDFGGSVSFVNRQLGGEVPPHAELPHLIRDDLEVSFVDPDGPVVSTPNPIPEVGVGGISEVVESVKPANRNGPWGYAKTNSPVRRTGGSNA